MTRFSNRWIKPYLKFSKKDRNGILILSILIAIIFFVNIIIDYYPVRDNNDYTELEEVLAKWEELHSEESIKSQYLFQFNPNTISVDSLDSLLLPEFIKRNLVSYRKAGGQFKSSSDFRKIYGMNDSIYSVIKDYIDIIQEYQSKEINKESSNKVDTNEKKEIDNFLETSLKLNVELNSADSTDLLKLYGIGPVFASRIIKYRNLLGGFYTKEQLLEVYNFPEETYISILENITIDVSKNRKIRLNFADYSELLRHPYLNKQQVQTIINYRTSNGNYKSVEDLIYMNLIDSATYIKVSPYLNCR